MGLIHNPVVVDNLGGIGRFCFVGADNLIRKKIFDFPITPSYNEKSIWVDKVWSNWGLLKSIST